MPKSSYNPARVDWLSRLLWRHWHPLYLLRWLLSENVWEERSSVPLNHRSLQFRSSSDCDQVATFTNDAWDVALGYPDKWHVIYRREDFNRIVRWYVWNTVVLEWCGLRRWIWFKILHWDLRRHRKNHPVVSTDRG